MRMGPASLPQGEDNAASAPKAKKALFSKAEKSLSELYYDAGLVRAAWKQCNQHHQIRRRKQPLVRLQSGSLRSARYETQMAAFREISQML